MIILCDIIQKKCTNYLTTQANCFLLLALKNIKQPWCKMILEPHKIENETIRRGYSAQKHCAYMAKAVYNLKLQ